MSSLKDFLSKGLDTAKSFNPLEQVKSGAVEIVKDLAGKGAELLTQVQEGKLTLEQAKIELEKFKIEAQYKAESNITERWKSDNKDGTWLAKNVRPLSLAWALTNATLMIWADSVGWINVQEKWIGLITSLILTIVNGYFVLRSFVDKRKTN